VNSGSGGGHVGGSHDGCPYPPRKAHRTGCIEKTVETAADWGCTYSMSYDFSWRRIEMRVRLLDRPQAVRWGALGNNILDLENRRAERKT